jgi:hypothetical protein
MSGLVLNRHVPGHGGTVLRSKQSAGPWSQSRLGCGIGSGRCDAIPKGLGEGPNGSIGEGKRVCAGLVVQLVQGKATGAVGRIIVGCENCEFPSYALGHGRGGGQRTMGGSSHETRGPKRARAGCQCQRRRKNASFWSRQIMQAKVRSFYHAAMLEA